MSPSRQQKKIHEGEVDRGEVISILNHDLQHVEEAWRFFMGFFTCTAKHPTSSWHALAQLLDCV